MAYNEDLAYIHDAGYGDFARNAFPGIRRHLRKRGIDSGLIVDLGCGSGILAQLLLEAGYRVHGIDHSEAMISLASKRAPGATFSTGSFFTEPLPDCAAVVSTGECLNYLFDPDASLALPALFQKIFDALQPGALFIFDLAGPGIVGSESPAKLHETGDDWAVLITKQEQAGNGLMTREITMFRALDGGYRRSNVVHHAKLYHCEEITRLLREAGFRVQMRRGYGTFRLSPKHRVFLAGKPRDGRKAATTPRLMP